MNIIKKTATSIVILIISVIMIYGIYISAYPVSYEAASPHNIGVVFGAGITRSGDPSPALKFRLEKSVNLYLDRKIKKIFVSGRNAEAVVMRNYLLKKGIPQASIVTDTNGETTFITVKDVKEFIISNGFSDGPVFISQKYHIPRIIYIVHKLGIEGSEFIAASPNGVDIFEGTCIIIRETFAWLKNILID
jgi:vancomycin permeability regulator SanA